MKRGEIWTVAGGVAYAGKPRPAVIVQDDRFDANDSIIVCPLTTDLTAAPIFRLPVQPSADSGLRAPCRLMVDKLTAVPRKRLGRLVGALAAEDVRALNRAVFVFLGLSETEGHRRRNAGPIAQSSALPDESLTLAHILCPVDFSEVSAHALEQATVVAGWYHAKITVLYVYTSALPASMPADSVESEKIQRLQETARSFAGPAIEAKRQVDVIVDIGHPAQQILARASALGADMIVMGTHGASGFQHFTLGSVTEKVLRKASCPVLTVSPRAHAPASLPFTRILCPIDFSNPSLSALEWTWSLAQESQAAVTLLHVIEWPWEEPPAPHLEELPAHEAQKLAEFRRELETTSLARLESLVPLNVRDRRPAASLIRHGKAHREVLAAAAACQADLIVMGVHGRNVIDLSLFGSTTNHVVRAASCPVLTVRARQ